MSARCPNHSKKYPRELTKAPFFLLIKEISYLVVGWFYGIRLAGFKEISEEGKRLEKEIKEIRERYHHMRIIGPNCLGIIRPKIGLNTTFSKVQPEPGKIGFISQSGVLGEAILAWATDNHIGFSFFASLGSMLDLDLNPIAISNGKAIAIDARIIIDHEGLEYTVPYPHLVITPYPAKYITSWKLPDGTEVLLRPIRPEDEPLEREFLSDLSEETLRMRFFRVI